VIEFQKILKDADTNVVPAYLGAWGENTLDTANYPVSSFVGNAPAGDTITAVAGQLKAKAVSPVELVEQALATIEAKDSMLNAFQVVLADYARAKAKEAEQAIMAGDYRGALHGVPVAVKDLYAMRGTVTTAGSKILADNLTDFDAAAVEKLEQAGAIIIGKTRMSEFAYSPGSNNAHYGTTRNPNNLERDTGGSSSGSGSAVAAGMVFGALGSDTGGSIRIPAALCGIVGLKPTFGRISLHGAVTLAWSLDHCGPMTRSVSDAAIMLEALAGFDPRDPRTRQLSLESCAGENLAKGVKGLRIGVVEDDLCGTPPTAEAIKAWRSGLAKLQAEGAEIIELALPQSLYILRMLNGAILGMEALAFHQPNLQTRLSDYGEFMRQRILSNYAYEAQAFIRAQQVRQIYCQNFNTLWQKVDLICTPTTPYGAPPLATPCGTNYTAAFNLLGLPSITVPVGKTEEGLPLGLQITGKAWQEALVLRVAQVVE
jgi:aspartyl-tRNA(Asn)/glutamyl-tRNA(Gln) amidotransferase subunit A